MQVIIQCAFCNYYTGLDKGKPTCKAFEDRIPMEIITGEFDHSEPHPGDNGLQFSPDEDTPPGLWKAKP